MLSTLLYIFRNERAISGKEPPQMIGSVVSSPFDNTELRATDEMCLHCFDVLLKYILKEKMTSGEVDFLQRISPNITCPLFVTWDIRQLNIKSKLAESTDKLEHKDMNDIYVLRGCIGSLSPKTLKSALSEYALASALQDRRFQPISQNEIPFLRVAVSLLVQYEECNHVHDWEIGKHGIIIKFSKNDVHYSGRWGKWSYFILRSEFTHNNFN